MIRLQGGMLQEIDFGFVVAICDSFSLFEFCGEVLDEVAGVVEVAVVASSHLAAGLAFGRLECRPQRARQDDEKARYRGTSG